jgi:hypothetical protein
MSKHETRSFDHVSAETEQTTPSHFKDLMAAVLHLWKEIYFAFIFFVGV